MEAVPLMNTSTPRLVIVQNVSLTVSDFPEGVQRSFLLLWNSGERSGRQGMRVEEMGSPIAVHRSNRIDDSIALRMR
jgi:hypothetical protein